MSEKVQAAKTRYDECQTCGGARVDGYVLRDRVVLTELIDTHEWTREVNTLCTDCHSTLWEQGRIEPSLTVGIEWFDGDKPGASGGGWAAVLLREGRPLLVQPDTEDETVRPELPAEGYGDEPGVAVEELIDGAAILQVYGTDERIDLTMDGRITLRDALTPLDASAWVAEYNLTR